jgi:hypothetical protein
VERRWEGPVQDDWILNSTSYSIHNEIFGDPLSRSSLPPVSPAACGWVPRLLIYVPSCVVLEGEKLIDPLRTGSLTIEAGGIGESDRFGDFWDAPSTPRTLAQFNPAAALRNHVSM